MKGASVGRISRATVVVALVALGSLALTANAFASPSSLQAATPTLQVVDLGQVSQPVQVGQPPITILPSGDCRFPFTLRLRPVCSRGTWPSLGKKWAPTVNISGGDALSLLFSSPVSAVSVASTSNWRPGQFTPSHEPILNYPVLGPTTATPSAEPTSWLVNLPQMNPQATNGYTFSVVAKDNRGYHDYRLAIRTPRVAACEDFYTTGESAYACGESTPP